MTSIREEMRDTRSSVVWSLLALTMLLAALSLCAGCRDGGDLSEMDRALSRFRDMPVEEQEGALREYAAAGGDEAKYAWYEMGNIYYRRAGEEVVPPGDASISKTNALLDSSLVFFGRAVEVDTTFVEALVNGGLVWDDLSEGRTPEARDCLAKAKELYQRAAALRPGDEKACCNLGSLFYRRRQFPQAIEQYKAVLAVNPESALAHYNLAIMFAEAKMYREAITEWEAAAKYDKDGEVGDQSRENVKVMRDLMEAKIPASLTETSADAGH